MSSSGVFRRNRLTISKAETVMHTDTNTHTHTYKLTDRQDISLPCMLENTLENVNYGAEFCGAAFFLLLHFLESTHFLVAILFGTSVLCSSVTVTRINIDAPFS